MKHLLKVQLDFNTLIKHGLDPNEYVYLYIGYHQLHKAAHDLGLVVSIELLEEKGWVECVYDEETGELVDTILRPKAIGLFEESDLDTKFYEFYSTYPIKVPNDTGGYRPLRAREITSKQAIELKKVYTSLIKHNVGLHAVIMRGLKAYMEAHKHKLTYMHSIEKFVGEHIWELYMDSDLQQSENKFSHDV